MAVEIIPAILVKTEEKFRERFRAVESLVPWVQIDVVDGTFAPNVTWGDPSVIAATDTKVKFEIDLMVVDPERAVREWIEALSGKDGRIFFHYEAVTTEARRQRRAGGDAAAHNVISRIKEAGLEAGMSLNPGTPAEKLITFAPRLDAALFLGVPPGFGGQVFQESVIKEVAVMRERFSNLPIEVDGGVNVDIAPRLVEAGATRLAAGSFIFQHANGPAAAITELKDAAG